MAKIAVISARAATRGELTAYLARAGHLAASFAQIGALARRPALLPFDLVVIDLETPGTDPGAVATLRDLGLQVPVIALLGATAERHVEGPGPWRTRLVVGPDAAAQVVAAVEELTPSSDEATAGEDAPATRDRHSLSA
ncbi:MAG: hypothetical protein ABIL09_14815 [Gemmatimonadota bacterium]